MLIDFLLVTRSVPDVASTVTGQADATDVLEGHDIRLQPEVFDSVEMVNYFVC